MPHVQSRIADPREHLEIKVTAEVHGYWRVSYRHVVPGFGHRGDWREAEHLSDPEVEDVICAVWAGWSDDVAQPF